MRDAKKPAVGPGWRQHNTANGGSVYATQGGNINIHTTSTGKRGLRIDSKVLLVALPVDAILFCYGMLAYTGRNTTGDNWRAGIFLFMLLTTLVLLGRWIRRRI